MRASEVCMRLTLFRALLLGVLMATLILPAGELQALAPAQQPPPPPQQPDKQEKQPGEVAIPIRAPPVTAEEGAPGNSGNFITRLKEDKLRILGNGGPPAITHLSPTDPR